MENEQKYALLVKGVVLWIFSQVFSMILKMQLFNFFFFLLFILNNFYKFWDFTFVAFEIIQNEWEMNKI
jgi:hypothetical protein